MAYAAASDLIARKDVNVLGDLVSDSGARVSSAGLASDTNMAAALDDASGLVDSALLQGKRYSTADLSALTGNSAAYLKRIVCDIAFWLLWDRKPAYGGVEDRAGAREQARQALDDLRTGKHIFDVEAVKEAGLPSVGGPTVVEINRLNLIVDRARPRYYPQRIMPDSQMG